MTLDVDEALFSLKCFIAAMLAYYVALRIGLTRPYWALTTSYIVAQPLAGAVLSKAVFRLIGTAVGAAAAVVLVPAFVNEPPVLSIALALWLGLCLYLSLLDRTPRAYTFLLAGYTASIIGFPSVDAPGAIFTVAILRVQEIVIGILAGSLIHGVIFPRTVAARLIERVEVILGDAERWSREALGGSSRPTSGGEQRRISIDLSELDQLSVHLPFDTARIVPRTRTVRALQDQLLEILPLASSVEDRLLELERSGGVPREVARIVTDTQAWLAEGVTLPDRAATADGLLTQLAAISSETATKDWRDMLILNLCSRLGELIAVHRDARELRDQIRSPSTRAVSVRVAKLLEQTRGRALHRDHGLALRAAVGTTVCILIGCTFWIATAWSDGAGAVLIAGVCCALFGNVDRPGPLIFQFLIGSAAGLVVAMVYAFAIIPRVTTFETMAAVTAPVLLLLGSVMARPKYLLLGLGSLLGFANTVGFNASYTGDFPAFANGAIAQLAGTGFAVISVGLFQTIGTDNSVARLFRAGWSDVARRVEGRSRDERRWSSRMLDRIGLLLPRLAAREKQAPPNALLDALTDMRTGIIAGRLRAAPATDTESQAIQSALAEIGGYFRALSPASPVPPPAQILSRIDAGLALYADDPDEARSREGLILFTSLRRNLFPDESGFKGAA